jgi:hypothetical protein
MSPAGCLSFIVSQKTMKPMAKAMSDQQLVAFVYHGWTLKSASYDSSMRAPSEFHLEWDLPESPRRPSDDEASRFCVLSAIEASFELTSRGIVITPGLPRVSKEKIKVGDLVVLHDGKDSALLTEIRSIELPSPPSPGGWPLLLGSDVSKRDVSVGMQVWIRR